MSTTNKILKSTVGYLSIAEVASLRHVTTSAVYRWLKLGLRWAKDRYGRIFVKRLDAEKFTPEPSGFPKGRPRKLSPESVSEAIKLRERGEKLTKIAGKLGVGVSSLWYAMREYRKKNGIKQ